MYLYLSTTHVISHLFGCFANLLRCSVLILPHGMAVTGTDCTQMPGIGRTFTGYSSMITCCIRHGVAYLNCLFRGTHKFLRVHQVCGEMSLSAVCGSQSCVHAPLQHVLVTVSTTRINSHAHPSLRSHTSGHGEFNIIGTSFTSGTNVVSVHPVEPDRRALSFRSTERSHLCSVT